MKLPVRTIVGLALILAGAGGVAWLVFNNLWQLLLAVAGIAAVYLGYRLMTSPQAAREREQAAQSGASGSNPPAQ